MSLPKADSLAERVKIRTYKPSDQQHVNHLYKHGLLEGEIPPNDTGADIENIAEGYFNEERAHFWVAELDGELAGMIGVAPDGNHLAEIRRLRVLPKHWGKGIRIKLLETALTFCRHHGYLKVVLDTRFERGGALELFERFAFQHTRSREVPGKETLEFYLDLYRDPKREEE
jgi:putative acetyltransferase